MKQKISDRWLAFLFMALAIGLMLFLSSCSTRKVEKRNEKVKLFEVSKIERTAPGDRVYIEFPRTPKDRPKSTTKTYNGKKGAFTDVDFDSIGNITAVRTDCPEVEELENRNTELQYQIREKQSTREFNAMAIKEGKGLILWMTAIISAAWVIRGFFKK